MSRAIPAVGYLRRSTQKQEKSLADQKKEVQRYAAEHGYRVLRWYQDDGISGDQTERRTGFKTMHHAACNGRDFDVILCWDLDRFGRFDSTEAGYWVHPLRKAGVRLITVTEGPIDWHGFAGRIVNAVKQEGKHQFLVDLSRNTTRGQISNAAKGNLCGQAAPYGYDRMLVDENGQHRQRVRNGETFAKAKTWHVKLVPSDDPEKVRVARWLFTEYASNGIGIRSMVDQLNIEGIPGPRGGKWYVGTVRDILRNEAYKGTFVWGKRAEGKYHRVAGDTIEAADPHATGSTGRPKTTENPRELWTVVDDAWEPLVDKATWEKVQRKLTMRKKATTAAKKKNGDAYLLSGTVHCGHCGQKMYGRTNSKKKDGKRYHWPKYTCSTAYKLGKSACGRHSVDQGRLLDLLIRKVQEAIQGHGGRDALREAVLGKLRERQAVNPGNIEARRSRLAELDAKVDRAAENYLAADDSIRGILAKKLEGMRADRDRAAAELAAIEGFQPTDVEAEADRITDRVWKLGDELARAKPARLRELISQLVERIELFFGSVEKKTRIEHPLERGRIVLQSDPSLCVAKLVSRGERI